MIGVRCGIDDVRNDRASRGERARAPAVQHHVADAVALQKDGVEAVADRRERVIFTDKRRVHAHFHAVFVVLADGKEFEHIAEVLAVRDVYGGYVRNAFAVHFFKRNARMECQT